MLYLRGCFGFGLALMATTVVRSSTYEVAQRHPGASDAGPGTREAPWKTLAHAAGRVRAGDVVVVRGGVYRERVVVEVDGRAEAPIQFEAAAGERVVVTGADVLTGWTRVGEGERPIYEVPWPHRFITWNRSMAHPNDARHRLIGRCEQVIIDDCLLRQVLEVGQLAPGTFLADVDRQRLLVWDAANRDLGQVKVEAATRQEILRLNGDHVQVRGWRFRYAANMAQHGAVVLAGGHDVLEDCVVEATNASGAGFLGEDAVVRRCVFRDNGQLGFGAGRAHRLLFTECSVENNNTKGFDRGWEAGGNKLALCRDAVLERSRFARNRGNGIWFDIGNTHCTVRQCLIADNEDAGIFYEISFALRAEDNVIVGNGYADTAGAWGAQAGISLSSSPGCVIERNLIVGNREGFNFREQPRTTPTIEGEEDQPVWNRDELIRRNVIAWNRDAQVWGWFDVEDGRHWPAGGPGLESTPAGRPGDLTLEALQLRFADNVYFAGPGQGWFEWGTRWRARRSYPTLEAFQAHLQIDSGSRVAEPRFVDLRQRDFRVRGEKPEWLSEVLPRGPIPGVILDRRD